MLTTALGVTDEARMSAVMGFSEIIGRRVRLGDWQDQKISTYRKIHGALDEGRFADASELAAYFEGLRDAAPRSAATSDVEETLASISANAESNAQAAEALRRLVIGS